MTRPSSTLGRANYTFFIGGLKDLTQREQKTLHSVFYNLLWLPPVMQEVFF